MQRTGNTILITGGGSGIGQELAHRWHDLGNTVIIAGRRRSTLEKACLDRPNMDFMTFDASDASDITRFAQDVIEKFPTLNVLINNAGMMKFEELDHSHDITDAEATIATNLLGPIRLTNALQDHLLQQLDPTIVNVTSGLAFVPLITTPTYNATKAALHSYSISLREALKGKAEVIEIVPPAVQTDLTPGQRNRSGYMPLTEFIDEVMVLFAQTPTPQEILVERVRPLREAEASDNFNTILKKLNDFAAQARKEGG